MAEVFDTIPVLTLGKGGSVTSLAVLGDTLYVGGDDGSLRVIFKKSEMEAGLSPQPRR